MIMQAIVNFIDDFKNIYVRVLANFVCLTTMCALTVWGIIQILNHPFIQCWIGVLSVTVDVYMQYVLAYGKWLWRTKIATNRWRAVVINFLSYLIYTLAYNFFFAVGFFMVEFDTKSQIFTDVKIVQGYNQQRIEEINNSISILNKHLETESQSGYGTKSQKIVEEKDKLIKERNNLLQDLTNTSYEEKIVYTNVFEAWSKNLNRTANWLKIISFSVLVLTVQIILIWSSWDIDPMRHKQSNSSVLSQDKKEFLKWLDAAFENRVNGALNGINSISEATGLTVERCAQIRDYLANLKVNGGMAIIYKQGVCKALYDKNFIRDYILSH